ncbi:primase C-terminal domain-containing protein [uncultured Clostridium sp.]|uniref:primase C-terminal domain-containing protein n=1 Tax=uncultured Clostridium sp. TaxID=59620 RepID=UPI00258C26A0|nr:DNA-binding response regulator [uncultured Clostridium sp.]
MSNATNYCKHLFDETTDGYIQLIKLENKDIKIYNGKNEELREIVEVVKGDKDVFLAPNTMYRKQRRVQNIRQFRALFQDLDLIKLGYHKSEVVYMIWDLYYEGKIPKPTMVVDSGRGIHVYWRISNAPYGALNAWQELQDYLYYQLKHLGADKKATDGARVLRLPSTINSKSNTECEVLYIDNELEYSMYELREKHLNYKPKQLQFQEAKTIKTNNKVISNQFFNSYSLHIARVEDLETLCKLRNYDMKGIRNALVHCYTYWKGIYTRDLDTLESEVIEFNNSFIEPLKESEIRAILRSVPKAIDKFINYEQGVRSGEVKRVSKGMRDKEGYWYKNDTLIDMLYITYEEQRHLKTIIGTQEKYRRNNERRTPRNENGLTKREQEKQDKIKAVKELHKQGYKQVEIVEKLGLTKGTVSKYIKL